VVFTGQSVSTCGLAGEDRIGLVRCFAAYAYSSFHSTCSPGEHHTDEVRGRRSHHQDLEMVVLDEKVIANQQLPCEGYRLHSSTVHYGSEWEAPTQVVDRTQLDAMSWKSAGDEEVAQLTCMAEKSKLVKNGGWAGVHHEDGLE